MNQSYICNECNKKIHTIESLHTTVRLGEIKFYHKKCYYYANSNEKRVADKEKNIRKSDIYYLKLFEQSSGLYRCLECGDKYDSLHHAAIHYKTVHRKALRKFIDVNYIETTAEDTFFYLSLYAPAKRVEYRCKICGCESHQTSIRTHVFNTHFRGNEVKPFKSQKPNNERSCTVTRAEIKQKKCLNARKNIRSLMKLNEIVLKPWKDPESLFCDTIFLNETLGLDVRNGDECKDNQQLTT